MQGARCKLDVWCAEKEAQRMYRPYMSHDLSTAPEVSSRLYRIHRPVRARAAFRIQLKGSASATGMGDRDGGLIKSFQFGPPRVGGHRKWGYSGKPSRTARHAGFIRKSQFKIEPSAAVAQAETCSARTSETSCRESTQHSH